MRRCKQCSKQIQDELEVCPFCGHIELLQTREDNKSTPINVIRAEKKENQLYNLTRSLSLIPIWVKVVVPMVIVVLAVLLVLIKNGVFDSIGRNSDVEETLENEELIIPSEVLTWGYHSYACFDHCETWQEAEEYCEALGGHLAVISSPEENEAVYNYVRLRGYENAFIGYSDSEIEGVWRWVNGERSDFTNWNEGEPNAFTNDEDYARFTGLNSGVWNDSEYSARDEDGLIGFVCEWDSVVTGTSNISYEELIGSLESNTELQNTSVVLEESNDVSVVSAENPYDVVMNCIDENEADYPGSQYAIDLVDDGDNSYWALFIRLPDGSSVSYSIDGTGQLQSISTLDDYNLVLASYESIRSLPCLNYMQNGYSYEGIDVNVSAEHPDGVYSGLILAVRDDFEYVLMVMGEFVLYSSSEIESMSIGDEFYIDALGLSTFVYGYFENGDVDLRDANGDYCALYLSDNGDGKYILRTTNDDAIVINRRIYYLKLADGYQFEEDPLFAECSPDAYNDYVESYVSEGNLIVDSFVNFDQRHIFSDEYLNLLHNNGFHLTRIAVRAEVSNNEIVSLYASWHP